MGLVISNSFAPSAIISRERYSVWVKREWGDTWQRVPYLIPESSLEAASPGDSSARLRWEYGRYVNLWYHAGGDLLPLNLDHWMVAIEVHSDYGRFVAWIGVIVGQTIRTEGTTSDGLPVGIQELEARGLEYLLERRRVLGTFVGDGEEWTYLPRTYDFNVAQGRRQRVAGNMNDTDHPDAGCRMFLEDGERWTNYEIIRYLLGCFQPWYPYGTTAGGAVSLVPLFYLTGQIDPLRYLYGEYRFHGKSVRECLDQLIDRRRGFGWHIQTDGIGAIYIRVYSLTEFPIVGRTAYIPANPSQGWVPVGWDHAVQVDYNISGLRQVDQIVVESSEPIRVCATLNVDDGSLEAGWSAELEAEYAAEADEEARAVDKYSTVFSRLQIPKAYSWADWAPGVSQLGDVTPAGGGSWWHHGKALHRWIPFERENVDGGEADYLEPFVVLAKANRTRDLALMLQRDGLAPYNLAGAQAATLPAITEEEFEEISTNDTVITAADLILAIAANPPEWFLLDRAQALDLPNCTLTLSDVGLAFEMRSKANHVFGLNWWDPEDSVTSAEFDYAQALATMFWDTDMMLRVVLPVFNAAYTTNLGEVVYEQNPQGRQIHIVVPGAECWVTGTDTVKGVEESALVYHGDGSPAILRNDWEDVWWTAVAAYVWYGTQRGAASLTIQRHAPWFRIGDLIRGTINGYWGERLGTTVTSIERNYSEGVQVIRTGYGELDPEALIDAATMGGKRK